MSAVPITEFDLSKIIFSPIQVEKGVYHRSAVGYKGVLDEPQLQGDAKFMPDSEYLYISTPLMPCYGVYPTYQYNPADKVQKRTPDKINGYQVIVPLTSEETVANPTPTEQKIINFFIGVREELAKFMIKNREDLPTEYQGTSDDKILSFLTNPIVTRSKVLDETDPKKKRKIEDPTKPLHLYLQMMFYKADPTKNKLKADKFGTKVFGPGDIPVNPLKYLKKFGDIQMVFRFRYVSYGKKASVNLQLFDANYVPKLTVPRQRIIGKNTAPLDADITNDEEKLDAEGEHEVVESEGGEPEKPTPKGEYNPDADGGDDEHTDEGGEPPVEMHTYTTKTGEVKTMPKAEYDKLVQKKRAAMKK